MKRSAVALLLTLVLAGCADEPESPEMPGDLAVVTAENDRTLLGSIGGFVTAMRASDTTRVAKAGGHGPGQDAAARWLMTRFGANFRGQVRAEVGTGEAAHDERVVCFSFGVPSRYLAIPATDGSLTLAGFADLKPEAAPLADDGWHGFCSEGRFF